MQDDSKIGGGCFLRAALKRKATDSVSCRPMKLTRQELRVGGYTQICASDSAIRVNQKQLSPRYPPHLWASEPCALPTTTNGAESFHADFNENLMLQNQTCTNVLRSCLRCRLKRSASIWCIWSIWWEWLRHKCAFFFTLTCRCYLM